MVIVGDPSSPGELPAVDPGEPPAVRTADATAVVVGHAGLLHRVADAKRAQRVHGVRPDQEPGAGGGDRRLPLQQRHPPAGPAQPERRRQPTDPATDHYRMHDPLLRYICSNSRYTCSMVM